MSSKLYTVQYMTMSSGLKGDYFNKKKNEVPDVILPEEVGLEQAEAFSDETTTTAKIPDSTQLKSNVRDLERETDSGNLYNTYKAARLTRKERNEDLESRFLHPDLESNSRVTIKKFKRDNFKRGL